MSAPAPRPVSPITFHVRTAHVGDTAVTVTRHACGTHAAFVEVGDEVWVTPVPDASTDSMRFAVAVLS